MAGPSPVSSHPNGSSTTHGHAGELGVDHLDGHAPTLRRELVLALRTAGPSSPDQLAALVGASRTGVLQQLRVLETDGLVSRRTERHGVGRPRHLYDVTASAQQLFPTNYDGLAAGLIAAIGAIGGRELVDRVFETRRNQTAERIRRRLDESLGGEAPFFERAGLPVQRGAVSRRHDPAARA
jgi:predicted ArsR family transcriptional regulator